MKKANSEKRTCNLTKDNKNENLNMVINSECRKFVSRLSSKIGKLSCLLKSGNLQHIYVTAQVGDSCCDNMLY